jgi:CubicO group peptidase (beta-lactamase class C family)
VAGALAAVDELAREQLERTGVPGLALGVLEGDEVETLCLGVEALATGAPVTPATTFRVASITKPFTAALARAVLDLDEPLETPAGPATPRLLLAHAGGLRCEAERPLSAYRSVSEAVADAGLRAWGEPGRLWVYSNAGYWLVAAAVERATGLRFEEAAAEHVLRPRGLVDLRFEGPTAAGHEPVAPGAAEHRSYPAPDYPVARRPSGGLVATVPQLLAFSARALGEPETFEPVVSRPGGAQAPGWLLERRGEDELVFHPGSAAGFQSLLVLVPGRRVAVAALSNSARGADAFRPVVEAALGQLGVPPWSPARRPLDGAALDAFAGGYHGADEEVEVRRAGGGLEVRVVGRDPFTGRMLEEPPVLGHPVGPRTFAVLHGDSSGDHFDFPERFFRLGSVLAERVR